MAVPLIGFLRGRVSAALGLRVEILPGVPGGMLTIEGAFRAGMNLLDGVHIGSVVVLFCTVLDKFPRGAVSRYIGDTLLIWKAGDHYTALASIAPLTRPSFSERTGL